MATKPNYQFEKRQRELAKKKKKAEKDQRKTHGPGDSADQGMSAASMPGAAPGSEDTPTGV